MNIGHYFIDRPRSAAVISIFIVLVGLIAYGTLPVSQYPEISPPTIVVRAVYPGATAEVVAQTVATPIEQEVNGVEGMLYMTSQSTSDGVMSLNVVFELGTDLDTAQVLVQNRISVAEPRLPEEVRRIGVTTAKSSPDLMMVVHLESPNDTYDDSVHQQLRAAASPRRARENRRQSATSPYSARANTACASGSIRIAWRT